MNSLLILGQHFRTEMESYRSAGRRNVLCDAINYAAFCGVQSCCVEFNLDVWLTYRLLSRRVIQAYRAIDKTFQNLRCFLKCTHTVGALENDEYMNVINE
jgi:hypothetical protein